MDQDRRLVFLILKDMEQRDAYSNLVINSRLKEGASSPAFIRELVYGILRNQSLLDYNIAAFLKKPGLKVSERVLLRMGFYQIALMDGVPEYAAVGETVRLAASFMKGRQGFINGVLRNFVRSGGKLQLPEEITVGEEKYLSVRYSCSPDIVSLWLEAYGRQQTETMLAESLKQAPLTIRANPLKVSGNALKIKLEEKGFLLKEGLLDGEYHVEGSGILETEEFRKGFFQVQDEASMRAVDTLQPSPGDTLIDLCAAPGGKCCSAAQYMENKGRILAFDYYEARAGLVDKLAKRLGISIITSSQADGTVLRPELENLADCVICDVPCSGLGVVRRKPEIKLRGLDPEQESLSEKQLLILHNASRYVNLKSGKLLYSTCTVNPEENGRVVRKFLENNPAFVVENEEQLFPSDTNDGFYICLLRRQNDQRRI